MDKEMYWFLLENKLSESSGQGEIAESELKCWLNMDKEMY